MTSLSQELKGRLAAAIARVVPPDFGPVDPLLRETADPTFGDYQSNAAMGLAKALKKNPRELAKDIVAALDLSGLCLPPEIAGPGFINLRLDPIALAAKLRSVSADPRLGIGKTPQPLKHVIDFSSPNLAKEMHVGHLRATLTGEVVARILEFQGHDVERVNHVGDWGTQFGMLLRYIDESHPEVLANPDEFRVNDLETFYKAAKKRFDEDEAFAEAARRKVVELQSGDPTARAVWKAFLTESLRHCHEVYRLLDVNLTDVGESFYNDRLPKIVDELKAAGLAVEDGGAVCVFLDGFKNREGEPLPFLIRKSDGGYNYATTDLAAMKYRLFERGAKRVVIVTDIRQASHFAMLFATSAKMGWTAGGVTLNHVGYGMVLGPDKRPFKTRDGDTVRLKDVIDEGIKRARDVIAKNAAATGREFPAAKSEEIARAVGIAAIKYFDLSHNLASDYVFDWDHMLAMEGNTGPYMLYAYARIKSVGRKAGVDLEALPAGIPLSLNHPAESALAKVLIRFGDVLTAVSAELKPNILTEYLYDLSKAFNAFYDKQNGVRIVNAESPELRDGRLLLCQLTARTLKTGLSLLSIGTVEEM